MCACVLQLTLLLCCGIPVTWLFLSARYLWADNTTVEPLKLSAPAYVQRLFEWIENQLNDESIFPTELDQPFPSNFKVWPRHCLCYNIAVHAGKGGVGSMYAFVSAGRGWLAGGSCASQLWIDAEPVHLTVEVGWLWVDGRALLLLLLLSPLRIYLCRRRGCREYFGGFSGCTRIFTTLTSSTSLHKARRYARTFATATYIINALASMRAAPNVMSVWWHPGWVDSLVLLSLQAHMNSCFKHFVLFSRAFGLVGEKEMEPLRYFFDARYDVYATECSAAFDALRSRPFLFLSVIHAGSSHRFVIGQLVGTSGPDDRNAEAYENAAGDDDDAVCFCFCSLAWSAVCGSYPAQSCTTCANI